METLIYILKSTALLSLFFLVYEFLLKRDTFFTLNRYFLIVGVLVAVALPFLTFTKTIVVEESITTVNTLDLNTLNYNSSTSQAVLMENPSFWTSIDFTQILVYLYFLGIIFFLVKFCISLIKLQRILSYRPKTYLKNGIRYIETDRKTNPFTFFKTVVYNPALHSTDELEMILKHETTHAQNWHSVDVLLGQLLIAVHWFNPLVWRYSKRIDQNLEFIADYKTTKARFPKKSYQMTLLRHALPNNMSLPVNNFYSFTKIRILMLNKNKSHHKNRLKVLLVLPFILIFLMSFQIETVTQIKVNPSQSSKDSISNPEIEVLNALFKNYDENAVLIFNGKKTMVKEIIPSTYKIEAVRYNDQGVPVIQAENRGKELLKLNIDAMPEGVYLQISEDSKIAMFVKNSSDKNDAFYVFTSKKEETSKNDKKEQTSKPSENTPSFIISKAKSSSANSDTREELERERQKLRDSFRNKPGETKIEVRYEVLKEREEIEKRRRELQAERELINENRSEVRYEVLKEREEIQRRREELQVERRIRRDSLMKTRSKEPSSMRDELLKERELERVKRSEINRIESVQVFKGDENKYLVGVDKDDQVIMLHFEIDENTSDASLKEIAAKFAEANVDFNYKNLRRNPSGKITKIKMTLNNRTGTQSKANQQNDDGIGSYTIGFNGDDGIYIKSKNQ